MTRKCSLKEISARYQTLPLQANAKAFDVIYQVEQYHLRVCQRERVSRQIMECFNSDLTITTAREKKTVRVAVFEKVGEKDTGNLKGI